MKRFTTKAVAAAVGMVCAGVAHAGSVTSPASDAAAIKYAIEALGSGTTAVTLPPVVYTMGVARPVNTNFTIVLRLSPEAAPTASPAFNGTCPTPTLSTAGASISVKRQSATECAYDFAVGATAVAPGDTITVTGLVSNLHTLNTSGSLTVYVNLRDQGETARIDNSAEITRRVAVGVQAVNIYAATSDTATIADVNATGGPLTGFIANTTVPADIATRAAANLTFDNNSVGAKLADGTTAFDFTATAGTATVVLTGTATGAAASGFCLDTNGNGTYCEAGEVFTLTPTTATLAGIASTRFPATGSTALRTATFTADGTTQLGTSRTFAVSGSITPATAGASVNSFLNTSGVNSTYWVWSANASQLMTPYFTTSSRFLSRYFLLNTGAASVSYSANCYAETGVTITYGASRTGTLIGNGLTTVNAGDVCTFSGGVTRGSVLFTINAPINTVKGSYQYIDPTSLNGTVQPLTRPYNQANPTE